MAIESRLRAEGCSVERKSGVTACPDNGSLREVDSLIKALRLMRAAIVKDQVLVKDMQATYLILQTTMSQMEALEASKAAVSARNDLYAIRSREPI